MKDKGSTLIELMIAMVVAAILVAGAYAVLINQQRSYAIQDQMAGIQQDARASLTIMSRDLRMAGFLTGDKGFSVNSFTYAVSPVNRNDGPDEITVVFAAEETSTVTDVTGHLVTLQSGGDKFDLVKKKYVAFEGVTHVYEILNISGNVLTLDESPPSYLADFGAKVFLVKALTYKVRDNALRRDENVGGGAQALAGAGSFRILEDLQLAYQLAGDNNWYNADSFPAGTTNADIRMVRINLLVRTPMEDPEDKNYTRPTVEDHPASTTKDGYRRRLYSTVVKGRNLSF